MFGLFQLNRNRHREVRAGLHQVLQRHAAERLVPDARGQADDDQDRRRPRGRPPRDHDARLGAEARAGLRQRPGTVMICWLDLLLAKNSVWFAERRRNERSE